MFKDGINVRQKNWFVNFRYFFKKKNEIINSNDDSDGLISCF